MALNALAVEKEGVGMIKKRQPNKMPVARSKLVQNSVTHSVDSNAKVLIEENHKACNDDKGNQSSSKKNIVSNPSVSKNMQAGLEKSKKDLQKQMTSLSHFKIVFSEKAEKSYKRINEVFKELHQQLTERQSELIKQMDDSKGLAWNTLETYEQKSIELRNRIDRAPNMKEDEVEQLKSDIKDFFACKRYFEDIAQSSRFNCDLNKILIDIQEFGEVYLAKSIVKKQELTLNTNGVLEVPERILSQSESLLKYEESTASSDLSNVDSCVNGIYPKSNGQTSVKNRRRTKKSSNKQTKFTQEPNPQPPEENSSIKRPVLAVQKT